MVRVFRYKIENFNYLDVAFNKLQAYHVGLNAVLGWPQASDQRLRKKDIYS